MMQRSNVNKNGKLKQLEYITSRVGAVWVPPVFSSQRLFSMYRQSDRRCSANRPNCCDCVSLQKIPVPYSLQWFCGRHVVDCLTPFLTRIQSGHIWQSRENQPNESRLFEQGIMGRRFIFRSKLSFCYLDVSMGVSSLVLHGWWHYEWNTLLGKTTLTLFV